MDLLKTDKNLNNKIIIFTESKETAEYLAENIKNKLKRNVILFSGSMSDNIKNEIRNNFDPNVDKELVRDDYDVLVTTDVLAEGMNLHRSNVIINYDLPWNPTRIMQRVGRINRVGTKHTELFVYNFFPTTNSNDLIHQNENIISKIQMFHNILGEDSKFLTDEENISTHELFKKMTTIDEEDETGLNTELQYLKFIREIRDKQPELFGRIKRLPKKIKIGRKDNSEKLITFFRKGYIKKFYLSTLNNTDEITFDDVIDFIKTDINEKSIPINSQYYTLLKRNKESFNNFESEENQDEFSEVEKRKGSSNAKNIIYAIKETLKIEDVLTEEEIDKGNRLLKLLQNGELPTKMLKDANKMLKLNVKSHSDLIKFYKDFYKSIPSTYFELEEKLNQTDNNVTEIILSELFIK